MEKEYVINYVATGVHNNCMQGVFDDKNVVEEVRELLESRYGDRLEWFVIDEDTDTGFDTIYDSRDRHYNITIHFKHDPDDELSEEFKLKATDLDLAKDFVKERDDFERINYYVIEEDGTGDDYYNSSEEPDFVDQSE